MERYRQSVKMHFQMQLLGPTVKLKRRLAMRREPSAFTWLRRNLTETVTAKGRLRPNLHRLDVTLEKCRFSKKLQICPFCVYPACCARCAAKFKHKNHGSIFAQLLDKNN